MNSRAPGGDRCSIERDNAYFTFASGRLSYSCVSCDAICCRGHGYVLRGDDELIRHLAEKPSLRFFVDRQAATQSVYHCRSYKPGCFLLTQDRLCALQVERGYLAKPGTCKLFPFNNIVRYGQFVVIAPHVHLCPLTIEPNDRRAAASVHDELWPLVVEMAEGEGVTRVVAERTAAMELVSLEHSVSELSESHLCDSEYMTFAAAQERLTLGQQKEVPVADAVRLCEEFCAILARVLDIPSDVVRGRGNYTPRALIVFTATLRARVLFCQQSSRPSLWRAPLLPRALMSLNAWLSIAVEAGVSAVTYQTVSKMWMDYGWLMLMLSYCDAVPVLDPALPLGYTRRCRSEVDRIYMRVLEDLVVRRQERRLRPLGDILCDRLDGCRGNRILLLKEVMARLSGRLVALAELGQGVRRPSIRRTLSEWAIDGLSSRRTG